jgi:hypothetical protein
MKLESLKSSKFEAFKGMEVKNPLKVIGGQIQNTTYDVYQGGLKVKSSTDAWYTDAETMKTSDRSTHWNVVGDMVYDMTMEPDPIWYQSDYQTNFFLK